MRQLTAHAFIQLPILDDDDTGTLIQKLTVQTEGPGAPSVPTAAKDSFHEMVRAGEVLRAAAPSAVAIEGGRAHESHLKVQRS